MQNSLFFFCKNFEFYYDNFFVRVDSFSWKCFVHFIENLYFIENFIEILIFDEK